MLGALILQQLHDVTEAETVEAIAFNLMWHYALGVPAYGSTYVCERTLRNYRQAVIKQGLERSLFQALSDKLIRAFEVDSSHQRLDSTVVCSAMRVLSRLGIVVETLSKFLRELARYHPTRYSEVDPEIIRLFVARQGEGCFALSKPSEAKQRLPEAATTLGLVVRQFAATEAAQLTSYQLLRQVFSEQCAWDQGNDANAKVRVKTPAEIPCDSVHSPADPAVSYNKHRGHGYGVQVMATYAEDEAAGASATDPPIPDLSTHVAVHKLTEHDTQALEPAVADVSQRQLCPTQLLGDSH